MFKDDYANNMDLRLAHATPFYLTKQVQKLKVHSMFWRSLESQEHRFFEIKSS